MFLPKHLTFYFKTIFNDQISENVEVLVQKHVGLYGAWVKSKGCLQSFLGKYKFPVEFCC